MQESTYGQSRIRNAGADSDRRATPGEGRMDGRKEDAFEMKNPQLESTKRRNLDEMQQPVARSAGR